jgi:hypothetical protein
MGTFPKPLFMVSLSVSPLETSMSAWIHRCAGLMSLTGRIPELKLQIAYRCEKKWDHPVRGRQSRDANTPIDVVKKMTNLVKVFAVGSSVRKGGQKRGMRPALGILGLPWPQPPAKAGQQNLRGSMVETRRYLSRSKPPISLGEVGRRRHDARSNFVSPS